MAEPTSDLQWLLRAQQMQNQNSQENNRATLPTTFFGHVASPPVSSHVSMARLLSSMKESEAGTGAGIVQTEPRHERRGEGPGVESKSLARSATRAPSQNSDFVGNHNYMSNHNANATFNSFIQPVSHLEFISPALSL